MDVPQEGHYGASQFFDGMDELAIHEISQAPQHESIDFVHAQLARTQQDNELMRQVKLYGKEQLNPALQLDTNTQVGEVPNDQFSRSFVLKPKGAKSDPKLKKKEPTLRLRKALKIVPPSKNNGRSNAGRPR